MTTHRVTTTAELEAQIRLVLTSGDLDFEVPAGAAATITIGSNQVAIFAMQLEGGDLLIRLASILARGAAPGSELFEYVARENAEILFGRMSIMDSTELMGAVDLWFDHMMFSEDFDPADFIRTLDLFAKAADLRDDDIVARFGGV